MKFQEWIDKRNSHIAPREFFEYYAAEQAEIDKRQAELVQELIDYLLHSEQPETSGKIIRTFTE